MDKPKEILVANLQKIWMQPHVNEHIKHELHLDCYNSLRSCMGYIIDYRTIVQYVAGDFIVNFENIWFCIDGKTFELKGACN